jgi:predicted transcriptional regulator
MSYQFRSADNLQNNKSLHDVVLYSINDFIKNYTSLVKHDNVFYISKDIQPNFYRITITGSENKYLYNPNKLPNENKFPNNYVEINKKLFIWYDEEKEIDEETIKIFMKYNLLVDNKNDSINFLDVIIDDSKKGVSYYMCKNNIANFKKIKSNWVKKSHPKLSCN